MIIQYTIVGAIILLACIWIVVKVTKLVRGNGNTCCGCSLEKHCAPNLKERRQNGNLTKEDIDTLPPCCRTDKK